VASFERRLTLFDLTMITTGASIGSGIFLTPTSIAKNLPSPVWMLGVWAAGALMTVAGALTFAELSAMMPRAGGQYLFLTEAYGDLVGFLQGWAYFVVDTSGAIAALGLAFAQYLAWFVPLGPMGTKLVALGVLAVLAVVNVLGVRAAATLAGLFTVLKLAAIAGIVFAGFAKGSHATTSWNASPTPTSSALAAGMIGILWSYGGWQHATFAAGEAKRPARDVPLALVLGATVVGVVYLATNVAYLWLLPPAAVASSEHVAADALTAAIGPIGGSFVAAAIAMSVVGTACIYTLTAPRMYWAMADRGLFFESVARIHPRFHTPARAIVIQTAWSMVLVLFWGTFDNLIKYVVFIDFLFFGLAAAAVFVLRARRPDAERPVRVFLYPLPPLVFISVCAWFVASTLVGQPKQAIAGLVFMGIGALVYRVWKRRPQRS
jgi:APA family basic amino acid/polyamine antiporter